MCTLKTFFLGSAALAFMTLNAQAADVETPQTELYDWSGFYIGASAGYVWADADVDFEPTGAWIGSGFEDLIRGQASETLSPEGFVGGLKVGWATQLDRLVLGIEGDFSYVDADDDSTGLFGITGEIENEADLSWLSTLRARAGFTFDKALIYATGGVALGDWDVSTKIVDLANPVDRVDFDKSEWKFGWVVGGGAEFALSDSWTLNAEYLYLDFGSISGDSAWSQGTTFTQKHEFDLTAQVVRAGISYHFQ
jgi:outer membrane immunogenic protein